MQTLTYQVAVVADLLDTLHLLVVEEPAAELADSTVGSKLRNSRSRRTLRRDRRLAGSHSTGRSNRSWLDPSVTWLRCLSSQEQVMPNMEIGSSPEHCCCSLTGCSFHSDFGHSQSSDFAEHRHRIHLCMIPVAEEED